jgi:pimeloyl-ACP methyl ester carboxylesterase
MKRILTAAIALAACFTMALRVANAGTMLHVDGALVQKSGSGPAVILIPGLGGGAFVYAGVIPELSKKYTVYAVTLPGFDGVPAVAPPYLPAFEKSIVDLIAQEHLAHPVVVGHSLGGHLAVKLAEDVPSIAAAMAIDALPLFPLPRPGETAASRATSAAAFGDAMLATPDGKYAAQQKMVDGYLVTSDTNVALVTDHALKSDKTTEVKSATEMMMEDLGPKLTTITAPVTILAPAPNDASASDTAAQYAQLYAGTAHLTVTPIAPSKHFIMLDQPEKFRTALDAFVAAYAH